MEDVLRNLSPNLCCTLKSSIFLCEALYLIGNRLGSIGCQRILVICRVSHLVFIARQPWRVHNFTYKTIVVFLISTMVRRPRNIHTFQQTSLTAWHIPLNVRRPPHVHTFTHKTLAVWHVALIIRRQQHLYTRTFAFKELSAEFSVGLLDSYSSSLC